MENHQEIERKDIPKKSLQKNPWLKRTKIVLFLILAWFLGVDKVLFIEYCDYCDYSRLVYQIRILTLPVYEDAEVNLPVDAQIAADLGFPCEHYIEQQAFQRLWGLLYSPEPWYSYSSGLGDSWYMENNKEIPKRVKALGKENRKLGYIYDKRVFRFDDNNFRDRFVAELRDDNLEKIALRLNRLSDDEIRRIVDRIDSIEWLIVEPRRTQPDQNAALILVLDELAAPLLVEMITDETDSAWLQWGSVGDMAHLLLGLIYNSDWPNSEFQEEYDMQWQDSYYPFYLKHLKNLDDQTRRDHYLKLQNAWRQTVEDSWKWKL